MCIERRRIKRKLTKNGLALLEKALRAIKRYPKSFNMGLYLDHDETVKGRRPFCGTTACLAGHIVLAAGGSPEMGAWPDLSELPPKLQRIARRLPWVSIPSLAAALVVGSDGRARNAMADALFYGSEKTHAQIARTVKRWLCAPT